MELLEDELSAATRAGGYGSREETVGHALEVLLAANPVLRRSTAIELYRRGKVTLSRAAELSGLELEAFKEGLAASDSLIRVDEDPEDIALGARVVGSLREGE